MIDLTQSKARRAQKMAALGTEACEDENEAGCAGVCAGSQVSTGAAQQASLGAAAATTAQPGGASQGASKRRRKQYVRRDWPECTNCDSKLQMRFGHFENDALKFSACAKCKSGFVEKGQPMKRLENLCQCGSARQVRYGHTADSRPAFCAIYLLNESRRATDTRERRSLASVFVCC